MTEFTPHPSETIPGGEMEAIRRVSEIQGAITKAALDPHKRGQHPKTTGLAQAYFDIAEDLPDDLKVGLFRTPGRYEALVRFSTGLEPKDNKPNTHAMAIKVLNADGSAQGNNLGVCQDFISLAFPLFMIQNVEQYVTMFEEALEDPAAPMFWGAHAGLLQLQAGHFKVVNCHLEQQFWGQTPIAFGNGAARFTIRPHIGNRSSLPLTDTANGLRDALADQLTSKRRTAKFDFCLQFQIDPASMSVEDPSVPWGSAFFTVAKLTIPPQECTSDAHLSVGENMTISPWQCLPEHRPLGGIQRCRKLVYEASVKLRHGENGIPGFELKREHLDALGAISERDAA